MNKIKKSLFLCAVALSMAQVSYAVPAYPKPFKVKQADGTYITIQLRGDEFSHLTYTTDGYPLVFNDATGNYDYAQVSNGLMMPSGIVAREAAMRSASDNAYLQTINLSDIGTVIENGAYKMRQAMSEHKNTLKGNGPRKITSADILDCKISDYPTKGNVKALVILVNFSDRKFQDSDAHTVWNNKLNGHNYTEGNATGSVWDFYHQGSNGQYDPDFVLVGPVNVPHTVSYYGGNSYSGDNYERVGELVRDATTLAADSLGLDYSQFDTDSDGRVDNVYFIYAGYGEADSYYSNTIWPHSYYYTALTDQYPSQLEDLTFNDKKIDRYTMSQELNGQTNSVVGIGTFTHEFGHVLGFADHYNTVNAYASGQLGEWDLMASGSYNNNQNTPPTLSAFERAQLGWLEPTQLKASTDTLVNLPCLSDSNFAYAVSIPDKPNEGFLIENRQLKGWDAYLPGSGILVWHIDLDKDIWQSNTVNNVTTHQRVDIVEADGTANADAGDPFPGTKNVTQFDFLSWSKDSVFSFADVQNADANGNMHFLLKYDGFAVATPDTMFVTDLLGKSMTVNWSAVSGARSYALTVSSDAGTTTYDDLADTTLTLVDLQPETDYTLKLVAKLGIYSSDTLTRVVKTLPLQFQERTITADEATDVQATSFRTQWEAVPETEHYFLTVNERSLTGTGSLTYDFTDRAAGMPQGWSSSSSTYRTSLYGEKSPSLALTRGEDSLLIVAQGDSLIKGLKFWWSGTRANNKFVVRYLNENNVWTTADTLTIEVARHDSISSFDFNSVKAVSIVFDRAANSGYGCIDDVELKFVAPADSPMMVDVDAGTETSYVVENLEANHRYSYTVWAQKGDYRTPASNLVVVQTLNDPTGIESIDKENSAVAVYFDLNGRRVNIATAPAGVYIVRQGGKSYKILKK